MINIRDTTGYRMYLYGVFAGIPTRTPEYFVDLKKFHRLAECVTNKANIVRCLSRALTHRIYIHTWSTEYSVSNVHWNMSHSADTSACSVGFFFFRLAISLLFYYSSNETLDGVFERLPHRARYSNPILMNTSCLYSILQKCILTLCARPIRPVRLSSTVD